MTDFYYRGDDGGIEVIDTRLYDCRRCDVIFRDVDFTDPRIVSHYDVASYTPEHRAQEIYESRHGWFEWMADTIIRRTGIQRGRMLDFGCSYGFLMDSFAKRGWEVEGVEIARPSHEYLAKHRPQYRVHRSLEGLPEGGYDLVATVDSLYYLEEPLPVLRRMAALLRPGGALWGRIATRNLHCRTVARIKRLLGRTEGDVVRLSRSLVGDAKAGFSRRAIRRMLGEAGLEVLWLYVPEPGKRRGWKRGAVDRVLWAVDALSAHRLPVAVGLQFLARRPGQVAGEATATTGQQKSVG